VIETADAVARSLTNAADVAVFVPCYRLAPERRFPAVVEDAEVAIRWLASNADELGLDGTRIAVGGDSVGGKLAAAVTHLLRDTCGPRLEFQLLVYPVTKELADTQSASSEDDPSSSIPAPSSGTGSTTFRPFVMDTIHAPRRISPSASTGCRPRRHRRA
jgi:acetyl esterase